MFRIFLSETFGVLDCLKYDGGVTGNSNLSIWSTSGGTPSVTSEYTKLEYSNTNIWHSCGFNCGSDFIIEFDIYISTSNTANVDISIRNEGSELLNYIAFDEARLQSGEWYHIKFETHNNICVVSNDATSFTRSRDITGYNQFILNCRSGEEVRYKNFKIYPI